MANIKKECSNCEGTAIKLCPWCKIDTKDETGKVISSRPGSGCRACMGKGVFVCPICDGKGYLSQDEIEIPGNPTDDAIRHLKD